MTARKSSEKKCKFLVLVDDDEYSKTALRFACAKAKAVGDCPVDMLYILEPSDFASIGAVQEMARKESRKKAEEVLTKMAEEANNFAGITPSLLVREGRYQEQVIEAINHDKGVNVLVIGTSPAGGGSKNKLVAWIVSQLGDKLHIPVMVVPGDLTDEQIKQMT